VSPLKSIHRAKIALSPVSQPPLLQEFFTSVSVPYFDALLREHPRVCATSDEPEEFLYDSSKECTFRSQEGERVICKREAKRWWCKDRESARARAVGANLAHIDDAPDEGKILLFFMWFCAAHG